VEGSDLIKPERVVFTFEYDLELADSGRLAPPDLVTAVIADAKPSIDELRAELRHEAARSGLAIEIEDVEIKEGSIVILVAAIVGMAKAIDLYGGARQGLDQILRDLGSICERFLWRFGGARMRPRLRLTSWTPAVAPSHSSRGNGNRQLMSTYLVASNCLLILALIGVLVVLLIRSG
jgi:hypothetical protein